MKNNLFFRLFFFIIIRRFYYLFITFDEKIVSITKKSRAKVSDKLLRGIREKAIIKKVDKGSGLVVMSKEYYNDEITLMFQSNKYLLSSF